MTIDRLLLVDGTNLVMRYAMAALKPQKGAPVREATEAEQAKILGGVERALREGATEVGASHVVVALDSSVDPLRRQLYPAYKANRTEAGTVAWTNRLALHLNPRGWYTVRAPGYEADDVIATLAHRAAAAAVPCAVISGDSDLLQLASLFCAVYQPVPKREAGGPRFVERPMAWIRERYKIPSAGHLVLWKALVGEPGDNLPGVEGIGPVKAAALLAKLETPDVGPLAELLAAAHGPGAVDELATMFPLVDLCTDVPLDKIPPKLCKVPDPAEVPV